DSPASLVALAPGEALPALTRPGSPGRDRARRVGRISLMERYWLLTTTFYGTWLPGDPRGFVSQVRDRRDDQPETLVRQEHNDPGTAYDRGLPGLHRAAQEQMKGPPIYITAHQATVLGAQFHETASHRGWQLRAVAIMANHLHIVVGVKGDPS